MFNFDLLENENVIAIYRQAETVLFKPVLIVFILIYAPWYFLVKYELVANYERLLIFWTILVFLFALNKYLLWLLNVYVLTNKRLINVNYKNLLYKRVLESPLDRILNISFQSKGFFQSLFQFGAVEVQVAGLPEAMVLRNLAHPSQIKDALWKTHLQFSSAPTQTTNSEVAHEVLTRNPKRVVNSRRL